MTKGRIEAFSDGMVAIIITIMVLELRLPEHHDLGALRALLPVFLSYVLSFANIAIYWNNHHHMFHAVRHVGGWVLWANMHWLFWLSLMPFATGFMAESGFEPVPVALYGVDLTLCAVAYLMLTRALMAEHGSDSDFAHALGSDLKGKLSLLAYVLAVPAAFVHVGLSEAIYVGVALVWIVPDRRFGRTSTAAGKESERT